MSTAMRIPQITQDEMQSIQRMLDRRLANIPKNRMNDTDEEVVFRENTLAKRMAEHIARHPNDLQAQEFGQPKSRKDEGTIDETIVEHLIVTPEGTYLGNSPAEAHAQIPDDASIAFTGCKSTTVVVEIDDEETEEGKIVKSTCYFSNFRLTRTAPSNGMSRREINLHSLTVAKLKVVCKSRGLKVGGKKSVLVQRLIDFETVPDADDLYINDEGELINPVKEGEEE
tara:strand:- start:1351 stop:2031 length:681 start_codon:yes stop_codon:yes gene_type:complete